MFWKRKISLAAAAGIKPRFFSFPGYSLVVVLTARSWLPYERQWCVKKQIIPQYLLNLVHDGCPFLAQTLKS
jgi:hypothetical protein